MSSSPKNSSAVMLYFFFNQSAKLASSGFKPNSIHSLVSSAVKPFASHFCCNSGVKFWWISFQLVIMKYFTYFLLNDQLFSRKIP